MGVKRVFVRGLSTAMARPTQEDPCFLDRHPRPAARRASLLARRWWLAVTDGVRQGSSVVAPHSDVVTNGGWVDFAYLVAHRCTRLNSIHPRPCQHRSLAVTVRRHPLPPYHCAHLSSRAPSRRHPWSAPHSVIPDDARRGKSSKLLGLLMHHCSHIWIGDA